MITPADELITAFRWIKHCMPRLDKNDVWELLIIANKMQKYLEEEYKGRL